MATKEETKKAPAEKKVVISDLATAVKEMEGGETIQKAIDAGLVKAALEEVEIESGKYSGDYVKLTLGEKATDEASIIAALVAISGGNLTAPKAEDSDEPDNRKPSLVKFALYGADLAARSRTSQRIKAASQGPDKAIEKMADILVKNKPNLSKEQALEMARALMAE